MKIVTALVVGLLTLHQAAAPAPPAPSVTAALSADSPRTTITGNTFIAPAGWTVEVKGQMTLLTPPEGDSHIALIDLKASDADAAVKAAWAIYRPDAKWPLKVANDSPDKDGWTNLRSYDYQTSPNEKRDVGVNTMRANETWTVTIYDMTQAVGGKRGAQVALIFDRLYPKGYERETFAGRTAKKLGPNEIAALSAFIEAGRQKLGVPGVALGLIQDGKVVIADGFGARELGGTARPDADTMFMIASNTKALTTLMLAKLVDEGKITWDTRVTTLLPSFKLGDADTTSRVLVKNLICACTGLPRQDYEWLFQYNGVTAEGALKTLGTMQPTTKFGELFQYSNPLAGAAGYVGGHVAFPSLELGAAYDQAMADRVFTPLGMTSTTFDYAKALAGNHATSHAQTVDGKTALALMDVNYSIIPFRPAGAAWSNIHDMLKYVQMELDEGTLPDGTRYIGKDALLARRTPQVKIGKDTTYGMGLMVCTKYDTPMVHHGGDLIGYHSDMLWLPEHKVGAVILTNANPGWILRDQFGRKLLEVLFDGRPEADADLAAQGKAYFDQFAAERKLLTIPAAAADAAKLAPHYVNDALGDITVARDGQKTVFDFGEWRSEMATRHNPDGSVSFITIAPGITGLEFVVGTTVKPSLIVRDAQHEYVFAAGGSVTSSK